MADRLADIAVSVCEFLLGLRYRDESAWTSTTPLPTNSAEVWIEQSNIGMYERLGLSVENVRMAAKLDARCTAAVCHLVLKVLGS